MGRAVGVVGLGIMGGAMAKSLVSAGAEVFGFDTDLRRLEEVSPHGIRPSLSASELANQVSVIITSLPSASAVHSTMRTISEARHKKIVIEASTLSLDDKLIVKKTLDAAGHIGLDCPISGTGAQARTKDLVVYASGDSSTINTLHSLFLAFARQVHNVGNFGNGTRLKLVANLLVAVHNVATAEAMMLAWRAGLDLHRVAELISSGAGSSRVFELRAPLMADGCYEPATMKLAVWQKDLDIISSFAHQLNSPVPLLSATVPIYEAANVEGRSHLDTASVYTVVQEITANSYQKTTAIPIEDDHASDGTARTARSDRREA